MWHSVHIHVRSWTELTRLCARQHKSEQNPVPRSGVGCMQVCEPRVKRMASAPGQTSQDAMDYPWSPQSFAFLTSKVSGMALGHLWGPPVCWPVPLLHGWLHYAADPTQVSPWLGLLLFSAHPWGHIPLCPGKTRLRGTVSTLVILDAPDKP